MLLIKTGHTPLARVENFGKALSVLAYMAECGIYCTLDTSIGADSILDRAEQLQMRMDEYQKVVEK